MSSSTFKLHKEQVQRNHTSYWEKGNFLIKENNVFKPKLLDKKDSKTWFTGLTSLLELDPILA